MKISAKQLIKNAIDNGARLSLKPTREFSMKDHGKRELVNALTEIAKLYSEHQSLREKIAGLLQKALWQTEPPTGKKIYYLASDFFTKEYLDKDKKVFEELSCMVVKESDDGCTATKVCDCPNSELARLVVDALNRTT